MVRTAIQKYLDGEIDHVQYMRLYHEEKSGVVQKSAPILKSDDQELISKAAAGDEEAYFEYGRRVSVEKGQAKQFARQEIIAIEKESNRQLKELISKSGDSMTDDQREAFIWTRNLNDITARYQNATRTLDMD